MNVEDFIKHMTGEWKEILAGAPVSFCIAVVVAGGLIWGVVNWRYSSIIENYESRLKLKDEQLSDYKEKLNGATPAEAKARLDTLEQQVKSLLPRRLSGEQAQAIKNEINSSRFAVAIIHDAAAADVKMLAGDFALTFQSSGWAVTTPIAMGLGNAPPSGVAVRVQNPSSLRPAEQAVKRAFENAKIPFDLQGGLSGVPANFQMSNPDVEIVLTSRLN